MQWMGPDRVYGHSSNNINSLHWLLNVNEVGWQWLVKVDEAWHILYVNGMNFVAKCDV